MSVHVCVCVCVCVCVYVHGCVCVCVCVCVYTHTHTKQGEWINALDVQGVTGALSLKEQVVLLMCCYLVDNVFLTCC